MGNDVPVVDLLALTGLGAIDHITDGLVVKYSDGHVVFAVSEVVGLERVPLESMRPLPPLGLADPTRFPSVFELPDGGLHLVLDHQALGADPEMATLGRLNVASRDGQDDTTTPLDDAAVTIGRSAADAVRYLRYVVGEGDEAIEFATPVEQIVGVGPVPADAVHLDSGDSVLGFFESGGRTVPLVCLARHLGLASTGSPALAAFVDVDDRRLALLVARFDVIAVPSWVEATTTARRRSLTFPGASGLVAELDLCAVGRGLLAALGSTR